MRTPKPSFREISVRLERYAAKKSIKISRAALGRHRAEALQTAQTLVEREFAEVEGYLIAALLKTEERTSPKVNIGTDWDKFLVPKTGWDWIKSALPNYMQFGWLTPSFKELRYPTQNLIQVTIPIFQVHANPDGQWLATVFVQEDPENIVSEINREVDTAFGYPRF